MPLTDNDIRCLIRQLMVKKALEVVRFLLCGNDTQCFSTKQYEDAWAREHKYDIGWMGVARMHLTHPTVAKLVREVQPDVWAAR